MFLKNIDTTLKLWQTETQQLTQTLAKLAAGEGSAGYR